MRTILTAVALVVLLPAAAEAQGRAIDRFVADIRETDPDTTLVITAQRVPDSNLAYVYVTDQWYNLRCYQRERLAKGLRQMWRDQVGREGNIVVFDRAETEVADFEVFGSGFDVSGCG